ncbi:hypothetical protein KAJ27_14750 [bacterium]|nr:hypothetical protein [bacterium]
MINISKFTSKSKALKRGMVLGWILMFIVVIFGFVIFANKFLNMHTKNSYLVHERMICRMVSESVLNQTLAFLSVNMDNSVLKYLIESDPVETNKKIPVYTDLPPILEEFQNQYRGLKIDTEFTILEYKPIYELSNGHISINGIKTPFVADGREASVRFRITVNTSFGGFEDKLSVIKNVKIIDRFPTVLSKFNLFVSEPEVKDDRINVVNTGYYWNLEGDVRPLVLLNGHEAKFLKAGKEFNELKPQFTKDFLNQQGWVYYGAENAVDFKLTYGNAVDWGENFHRRLLNYPSDTQNVIRNPKIERGTGSDKVTIELAPGFSIIERRFGFCKYFFFIGMDENMSYPKNYLSPDVSDEPASGIIHFMGAPQSVSPTLVFGNVNLCNVKVSGIRTDFNITKLKDGVSQLFTEFEKKIILPYYKGTWKKTVKYTESSEVDLLAVFFGIKTELLNVVTDNFETVMSIVEKSSPNYSIPWIVTNQEKGIIDSVYRDPVNVNLNVTLDTSKVEVNGNEIDFKKKIMTNDNVVIYSDKDTKLFDGKLKNALSKFPDIIKLKTVVKIGSIADLKKYFIVENRNKKELSIPGVLYIDSPAALNIPEISIQRGGIIITNGDITVSNSIKKITPQETLCLISLNGNIYINTDKEIQVGLMAPKGSVFLTKSKKINIYGFVLAKKFPIQGHLTSLFEKEISYDQNFDPVFGKRELGDKYTAYKYRMIFGNEEIRGSF